MTAEGGLSAEQVTGARERYGPNGESARQAGAAGSSRAAVSALPPTHPGKVAAEWSSPLPAIGPRGRAGRKRGLRKPLQTLWGLPARPRCTFAGEGGAGSGFGDRTPGSPTPISSLRAQGPVRPFRGSHLHPGRGPLPQVLAHPHRRCALDPRAAAARRSPAGAHTEVSWRGTSRRP